MANSARRCAYAVLFFSVGLLLAPGRAPGQTGVVVNSGMNVDGENESTDPSDTLSRTEVGLTMGGSASTEICPRTVRLDVRHRLSLTNINERRVGLPDGTLSDSPPTIRNRGLSISVGLVF